MRHWNHDGLLEDVATESAAGTIGAYRLKHGLVGTAQELPSNRDSLPGVPVSCEWLHTALLIRSNQYRLAVSVVVLGRGRLEHLP